MGGQLPSAEGQLRLSALEALLTELTEALS
jgi:hypothetical protein